MWTCGVLSPGPTNYKVRPTPLTSPTFLPSWLHPQRLEYIDEAPVSPLLRPSPPFSPLLRPSPPVSHLPRPLQGYLEYIDEAFERETPVSYGLHANAEINFMTQ